MNREEFENTKRNPPVDTIIEARELTGNNRTLLYGYDTQRVTWHVYLKNGEIHRVIYKPGDDDSISHQHSKVWSAASLIPNKRAYPERTDGEFTRLIRGKGLEIWFTTFNDDTYEQVKGNTFHGLLD
jgi:hypothetical protein